MKETKKTSEEPSGRKEQKDALWHARRWVMGDLLSVKGTQDFFFGPPSDPEILQAHASNFLRQNMWPTTKKGSKVLYLGEIHSHAWVATFFAKVLWKNKLCWMPIDILRLMPRGGTKMKRAG